jgi:hypothetical protein
MEMKLHKAFVLSFIVLIISTLVAFIALPPDVAYNLVKENGPVENLQVLFYLISAATAFIYERQRIWESGFKGGLILLIFALRELDFQKRFTGISITRTKYYFNSDAPLLAKLLSGLIVMGIIVLLIIFIKKNIGVFFRSLKNNEPWSLSLTAGLFFMFFSYIIDSSKRMLASIGFEYIEDSRHIRTAVEELSELAIPFFFLNALLLFRNKTKFLERGRKS